jgi:Zn-dependent oligopeptidase
MEKSKRGGSSKKVAEYPDTRPDFLSEQIDYSEFPFDQITPKYIRSSVADVLERSKYIIDQIITSEETTWDTIMAPHIQMCEQLGSAYGPIYLAGRTHPKKKVRDAALKAEIAIDQYDNSVCHNNDLIQKLRAYAETEEAKNLEGERARYVELKMRFFKKKGHGLDPADHARIYELDDILSKHETDFSQNIIEDQTKVVLGKKALRGMPQSYIDALPRDENGKYVVEILPDKYFPILQNSPNRKTREKIMAAQQSIAMDTNRPLLEEMVEMRQEMARVLGYQSWAHYRLEECMIKTPDEVREFYAQLIKPLTAKANKEIAAMTKLLHADGYNDSLQIYDALYYAGKLMEKDDTEEQVKAYEYFPVDSVLDEIFKINQELYGLRYEHAELLGWHEDIVAYNFYDTSGKLVSQLQLDLFARQGKIDGAFHMPLRASREYADGTYRPARGMIVASFAESGEGVPPVLTYDELHDLKHEIGHFLQLTFAKTEIPDFAVGDDEGYCMGRDYAELTAQVVEKWVEDPKMLRRISSHYKTGKKLSKKRTEQLLEMQRTNEAVSKLGRIALHLTDLAIHDVPSGKSFDEILRETAAITLMPHQEGTFSLANETHMTDYSAVNSGYDVSEVAAYDIFHSLFKPDGLTDRKKGNEFRKKVLMPAGTKDGVKIIRDLLGREPNAEAYLKQLGVSKTS